MAKGEPGLFVEYCAKDFLDGTQMLSPWEELAYRRVCDMIYTTNDRLVDDDRKLGWMTKTGRRWPAIKLALTGGDKPKLFIVDGRITNIRCQEALGKAAQKIAQQVVAGNASAGTGKSLKNLKQNRTGVRLPVRDDDRTEDRTNHLTTKPEEKPSLSGGQKEAVIAEGRVAKRRQQIPVDWLPDDAGREYACRETGWSEARIEREVGRFRDHHRSKGNLFLDVAAAWRTWVRNGAERDTKQWGGPVVAALRAPDPSDPVAEAALWRALLREFVETRAKTGRGYWPSNRGVPPGRSGCQVPPELLSEFGLSNAEIVAA